MKRCYLLVCTIVLLTACGDGSSPVTPSSDGGITETFNVTTATLRSDGSVLYGTAPFISVNTAGTLDAKASFGVVPGCEFVFSLRIPILLVSGNLVFDSRGTGPELSLHGDVTAGPYFFNMRTNATSSCALPPQGMPFPHTIVVTHP